MQMPHLDLDQELTVRPPDTTRNICLDVSIIEAAAVEEDAPGGMLTMQKVSGSSRLAGRRAPCGPWVRKTSNGKCRVRKSIYRTSILTNNCNSVMVTVN